MFSKMMHIEEVTSDIYFLTLEIIDCNVMTDGKYFFKQLVRKSFNNI